MPFLIKTSPVFFFFSHTQKKKRKGTDRVEKLSDPENLERRFSRRLETVGKATWEKKRKENRGISGDMLLLFNKPIELQYS